MRGVLVCLLTLHACVSGGETDESGHSTSGTGGADSGSTGDASDASAEGDACSFPIYQSGCGGNAQPPTCGPGVAGGCSGTWCACNGATFTSGCDHSHLPYAHQGPCVGGCAFPEYHAPGCGPDAPQAHCGTGIGGACAQSFCGCSGLTIIGCGYTSEPYLHEGPCESDAGADADGEVDSSDGDTCVWLYDLPGCGSSAPQPICTDGTDDACTLPFCGCDGITFMGGCGKSSIPFAAYGPCQGDGG